MRTDGAHPGQQQAEGPQTVGGPGGPAVQGLRLPAAPLLAPQQGPGQHGQWQGLPLRQGPGQRQQAGGQPGQHGAQAPPLQSGDAQFLLLSGSAAEMYASSSPVEQASEAPLLLQVEDIERLQLMCSGEGGPVDAGMQQAPQGCPSGVVVL